MKKTVFLLVIVISTAFLFSCNSSSSYNFLKDTFWVVSQETYNGSISNYPVSSDGTELRLFYEFSNEDSGFLYKYAANEELNLNQRQAVPFSYTYKSGSLVITLEDGSEHAWEMNLDGLKLNMKGNAISFLLEKDSLELYSSYLPLK